MKRNGKKLSKNVRIIVDIYLIIKYNTFEEDSLTFQAGMWVKKRNCNIGGKKND